MLAPEERHEIEAEFARYPTKQAVCIEAMRIVQRHRGWVCDEALRDIAELVNMTLADLDGVASFYNLNFRKPVGRHVIMLCDSVSCWIMGYERQRDYLRQRLGVDLGQTTADSRFTLLPIVCLGACDRAPVMTVDNDLHLDLDQPKIDSILENYP